MKRAVFVTSPQHRLLEGETMAHKCCAFTSGLFSVSALCASRAATLVNMDTYQNATGRGANLTSFHAAVGFYHAHGCALRRASSRAGGRSRPAGWRTT